MNAPQFFDLVSFLKGKKVISSLERAFSFTDEPKFPQWICKGCGGPQDNTGISTDLNEKKARLKAVAEAVERFCLFERNHPKGLIGDYKHLNKNAIDPVELINFEPTRFGRSQREYFQHLRNSQIVWVESKDLDSQPVLIPAQSVYSDYVSKEPLIRYPISTGAAFGLNEESAKTRGLLEVIERNNFMKFWITEKSPIQINLKNSSTKELSEYFKRYNLEAIAFDIKDILGIPSVAGIIIDRTGIGPAVSVGLKVAETEESAIKGALLEAQQVRNWIRFSYINDGLPPVDIPDIIDLKSRGYYWYPQKRLEDIAFLLESKTRDMDKSKTKIKDLPKRLREIGFETCFIDLTLPFLREKGLSIIKTVVPALHPLTYNENIPYTYSGTVKKLGKTQNKLPHPFV